MTTLEPTFRLIVIDDPTMVGRTAASPELAKLVPGDGIPLGSPRTRRLGMEKTDWVDNFGKPKAHRTVVVDAESTPNQWVIGA